MPKDRIAEFKRQQFQRNSSKAFNETFGNRTTVDSGDFHISMEHLGYPTKELDELADMWLQHQELKQKIDQIRLEQDKILIMANPDKSTQAALEDLMNSTKKDLENFRTRLKFIESRITEDELNVKESDGSKPLTDIRMRRTQLAGLATVFVSTIEDYKKMQDNHRERCKGRIKRQLEIAGTIVDDEKVEEMIDEGNFTVFGQSILQQTEETRRVLADVQARHNDILKLEQSIREIHELFQEMALLIKDQGAMIDNIARHVDKAMEYVPRAVHELKKGVKSKNAALKKKIWLAIILIIVLFVVGIIIWKA